MTRWQIFKLLFARDIGAALAKLITPCTNCREGVEACTRCRDNVQPQAAPLTRMVYDPLKRGMVRR